MCATHGNPRANNPKPMKPDRKLAEQAAEALSHALAEPNRLERACQLEKAMRLHRQAVEAGEACEAEACVEDEAGS